MNRKQLLLLLLATLMVFLMGCSSKVSEDNTEAKEITGFDPTIVDYTTVPVASLELESGEVIKLALFPELAPNTVNNFISLSTSGFYDGLIFHRVIPGFMIQGGDPLGNGMGNPGYSIKGEFTSNDFENNLTHIKGVLSMARSQDNDSAGSQFFIMQADYHSLDGQYASFGYVIEGIETVDQISAVETAKRDMPKEPVTIKSISIELNGYAPVEVVKVGE